MSNSHTINAELRDVQGTGASRRLRHAGKIPAILYGSGKDTAIVMAMIRTIAIISLKISNLQGISIIL